MDSGPVQVFELAKAANAGWLPVLLLVPTLLLAVVTWVFWPRTITAEVHPDKLTIRGSPYGRSIPRDELVTDRMRITDLDSDPSLSFSYRTNGVRLPGYAVGWFKLKNGDKALSFVTERRGVVYLPTRKGVVLLVSLKDPAAFVKALGATGPS